MKSLLIISYSQISTDPRVMRQINLLSDTYSVTVLGFGSASFSNFNFIEINDYNPNFLRKIFGGFKLLFGAFENYYWGLPVVRRSIDLLFDKKFDLILANDIASLPLALKIGNDTPVFFDAHEYSPREYENSLLWRIFYSRYNHYLCKFYLPQSASMMTVCQGIANEYEREYGVKCSVVHNAPMNKQLEPSDVDPHRIRLIHHGAAFRSRRIHLMIEMMKYLDSRFTLDLMLVNNDAAYMNELIHLAAMDSRIRIISPVPMEDICKHLNFYDVGVYLLPPDNFNHEYALPNKFFEFIQARLAVATGPSQEMSSLIHQFQCGVVSEFFTPQSLAASLQKLNANDIFYFKKSSNIAASFLNFESASQILISKVENLMCLKN